MGRKSGKVGGRTRPPRPGETADDEASDGDDSGERSIDAASSQRKDDDGVVTDEVTLELPGDDGTPDGPRGRRPGWGGFFGANRTAVNTRDDGSDTEPESTPRASHGGYDYSGNSSASATPRESRGGGGVGLDAVRIRGRVLSEGDEDAESVGSMSGDELLSDGEMGGGLEDLEDDVSRPGSNAASPRAGKGGIAGFGSPRFLKSFRRALSKRGGSVGSRRSDNGGEPGSLDDPEAVAMDENERSRLEAKREKKARKETKRRAKKARRRLKRLVHATNTMGAAVSAKDETNTQLALCMQLGLTMGLRAQRPANAIDGENNTDASDERDTPMTLNVGRKAVVDGSTLPAFRFIVHAPDRFEKVRSAWGLNLGTYQESFAIRPERNAEAAGGDEWRDAIASHELLGKGLEENTAEEDHARFAKNTAARRDSQTLRRDSQNVKPPAAAEQDTRRDRTLTGGETTEPTASSVGDQPANSNANANANANAKAGKLPPAHHARRHSVGSVGTDVDSDAAYKMDDGFSSGYDSDGRGGASRLLPSTTSLRVISTSNASGKSSSWFYCSKDGRFLVKTCTTKEKDVLLSILRDYSAHAQTNRGVSLLPQYYGLYSIEVGRRSAHFIVMNYWFATMHEINLRYDLKGSTKGRRASAKERAKGPTAIYKDLDQIERGTIVENKMASEIKAAIANDVEFMRRNKLVDYSMMLGVHFKNDDTVRGAGRDEGVETSPAAMQNGSESDRGVVSSDGEHATREPTVVTNDGDQAQPPSARDPRGGGGYFVDVYADHTASDVEGHGSTPPSPSYGVSGGAHVGFSADRTLARIESNKPMEREGSEFFSKEDAASTQFQLRALDTPQGLAYLGIIDILTQYTHVKAQETFWCGYVAGCGADISCQPPSRYARRFLRMLDRVLVEPRGTDGDESSKGGSSSRGGVGRSVDLAKVKTSA